MKKSLKQSKVSIKSILCVLMLIIGISTLSSMSVISTTVSFDPTSYSSLIPHDPISITSDSGLEVFPGSGTEEDSYLIDGYNITTTDDDGIYISGTTKYFIISNCYVDANNNGIHISNVADGTATVINNTCNNNYWGIHLWASGSSTVTNSTCNNNGEGGILIYSSGSSTVLNNTCRNNNNHGIHLYYSGSSNITNNTCCNSYWNGIKLYSSASSTVTNNMCNNNNRGIDIHSSGSVTVINNTCRSNKIYGLRLFESNFCVVTYNLLQENRHYGVYLDSDNNIIHHNNFIDNNLGGTSQAYDAGTNNTWHDTAIQEGNYWSDWSGTGSYSIEGEINSVDLYPLDELVEYSTVVSTTDETQIFFTFTLLIVLVPLLLIKLLSRKRLKMD